MQLKCWGTSCLDHNTVLGMDCVIGWKRIFDIHKGNIAWVDDYAMVRILTGGQISIGEAL